MLTITVIIPVYNEKSTILEILKRVQATNLINEIIIVDDCSQDGTKDILRELDHKSDIKIIFHSKNLGKGAAVRTGIKASSCEIIIIQDADLEYNPAEYSNLIKPIEDDIADVVYGSRFKEASGRPILFWSMVANKFLTLMTNILYNSNLTDMETGYKVFKRSIVENMHLHSQRFDFEPEFTAKLLKKKVRLYEVAISFDARDYTQGKKIKAWDGIIALWTLIKYRFID